MRSTFVIPLLGSLLLALPFAAAQQRADDAPAAAITPDRRDAALEFAERHHPELAELLVRLERRNEREFAKAVRQIFLVSDRLARLEARDETRYELQLGLWKLDSRIKLLAARLVMGPNADRERELRELVEQRLDLRLRQYEFDRRQLTERLRRVDESIERVTTKRESTIERELRRIRAGVKSTPVKVRTKPKT